jgi:hypothetical protein
MKRKYPRTLGLYDYGVTGFGCFSQVVTTTATAAVILVRHPVNKPIPGSIWFEALPDMTAFTIPSRTDIDPAKRT